VQLPPSKAEPSGRLLEQDESLAKVNTQKLRGLKPFFKQVRCNSSYCGDMSAGSMLSDAAWLARFYRESIITNVTMHTVQPATRGAYLLSMTGHCFWLVQLVCRRL
jgi:hypothetical protein